MAGACPVCPTCISRAGARVRPTRSPCNKALRLPSSKESSPSACLCAHRGLPECSSLSPSWLPSGSCFVLLALGAEGILLPVWLVETLAPGWAKAGGGSALSWVTWSLALYSGCHIARLADRLWLEAIS